MKAKRPTEAELLRTHVQSFVRGFGLLAEDRTPCGAPVSPREAHALMLLLERERAETPPRQNDLARALGIDKSNVTRLLQRLEEAGRIGRAPSDEDGRARLLRLTPKGRQLATSLEAASRARFRALVARIPADRRQDVVAALALLGAAVAAELNGAVDLKAAAELNGAADLKAAPELNGAADLKAAPELKGEGIDVHS